MAKGMKRVVLILVEGDCDETLLIDRLRDVFGEQDIRFEPQNGDILYDSKKQAKPIKEVIGETVQQVLLKRKFKPSDILAVLHIIDTDGCLIPEDSITIDVSQETTTFYQTNCISVSSEIQKNKLIIQPAQDK